MSKHEYSLDTLEALKIEINKLKEARKKIMSLDKLLLQQHKDITLLIKSGCNAKEIANMLKAANIQVGLAKVKKLYFSKKVVKAKPKALKNQVVSLGNDQDELIK